MLYCNLSLFPRTFFYQNDHKKTHSQAGQYWPMFDQDFCLSAHNFPRHFSFSFPVGNLNRELAALSTASRDLLESSQPKSSQQPITNHANSTYEHKSIRPPSTSTSANPVTASIQPMSLNNSSSLNTSSQSNQSNNSNQTFNSNAIPNRTSPPTAHYFAGIRGQKSIL